MNNIMDSDDWSTEDQSMSRRSPRSGSRRKTSHLSEDHAGKNPHSTRKKEPAQTTRIEYQAHTTEELVRIPATTAHFLDDIRLGLLFRLRGGYFLVATCREHDAPLTQKNVPTCLVTDETYGGFWVTAPHKVRNRATTTSRNPTSTWEMTDNRFPQVPGGRSKTYQRMYHLQPSLKVAHRGTCLQNFIAQPHRQV